MTQSVYIRQSPPASLKALIRNALSVRRDFFTGYLICFPGYDAKGSDLPPPPVCAKTWRAPILKNLDTVRLTVLIGGYAQRWHLGNRAGVTDTVRGWRDHAPDIFPLPHPSWRNTAWLKKNPWFEAELLPVLKARVAEVMA